MITASWAHFTHRRTPVPDRMLKPSHSESAVIQIVMEYLRKAIQDILQHLDSVFASMQQGLNDTSTKVCTPAPKKVGRGPLTSEEIARRRSQKLCFYCGEPSHSISECLVRPPKLPRTFPGVSNETLQSPVLPGATPKSAPVKSKRTFSIKAREPFSTPPVFPMPSEALPTKFKKAVPVKSASTRPKREIVPTKSLSRKSTPAKTRTVYKKSMEAYSDKLLRCQPNRMVSLDTYPEVTDLEDPHPAETMEFESTLPPECEPEIPMELAAASPSQTPTTLNQHSRYLGVAVYAPATVFKSSVKPEPRNLEANSCLHDLEESLLLQSPAAPILRRALGFKKVETPTPHSRKSGLVSGQPCQAYIGTTVSTPEGTITMEPLPPGFTYGSNGTVVRYADLQVFQNPKSAWRSLHNNVVTALQPAGSPAVAALHIAGSPAVTALQPAGFQEPCRTEVRVQEPCRTKVQVQVQEPCCTEVRVQEPCCTEVQVQEPCCTEVQVQEPCCTEVQVQEPCRTEVQVQEPCRTEVRVQEPCCTEVQVQEPCCTEVQVQEPCCTEVQVQEPCCTEVRVQEPCCTEVQEPCCTEVQVQEPCCTEVQVQEPCCTEVQVQEPCCTEVQVQEPRCTEVQVQEPCCTEVQVQEPRCTEVQVQEPCCTEVQVQEPCCTEVQVQEPCCTEVQEPRCTEVQEPRCTEVQEPRCTEVQEPRCTEVQEPRCTEVQVQSRAVPRSRSRSHAVPRSRSRSRAVPRSRSRSRAVPRSRSRAVPRSRSRSRAVPRSKPRLLPPKQHLWTLIPLQLPCQLLVKPVRLVKSWYLSLPWQLRCILLQLNEACLKEGSTLPSGLQHKRPWKCRQPDLSLKLPTVLPESLQ
uniref:Uncharacterized protein n=1 Tax=Leptobrachium leishanense TaxID=445787 RepID=A0A8C5P914_9ANUR